MNGARHEVRGDIRRAHLSRRGKVPAGPLRASASPLRICPWAGEPGQPVGEEDRQIVEREGPRVEPMRVRILELEGGLDPDEYCKERGADQYREALGAAKNYFYWLADRARSKYDTKNAEGRVAAFQFLLPAIHRLTDKIERTAIAGDVAGYLGVDSGLILENFRKAATDRREKTLAAPPEPIRHDEKILLNLFLSSEEARAKLIPELKTLAAVEQFAIRTLC